MYSYVSEVKTSPATPQLNTEQLYETTTEPGLYHTTGDRNTTVLVVGSSPSNRTVLYVSTSNFEALNRKNWNSAMWVRCPIDTTWSGSVTNK
jgi:hypothetical protein